MLKHYPCRCCGMGLAMAGFTEAHAPWNFYSARVATTITTDENDWIVASISDLSPWRGGLTPIRPRQPRLNRFAYKIDEDAESVLIEIEMAMVSGSLTFWRWNIEYELPFSAWDELVGQGRLTLNDYQTNATHTGFSPPQSPNDDQSQFGDIVLVWPQFELDWSNKRLRVSAATDTPIAGPELDATIGGVFFTDIGAVNLTWLQNPFEFVFDDSTYNVSAVPFGPFYEKEYSASQCYSVFRATHYDIISRTNDVAGRGVALLQFEVERPCGDWNPAATGRVAMDWLITGVWWKAFEQDGVVEVTEVAGASASPVLHTISPLGSSQRLPLIGASADVYPVTYTLSLLPIL